MAVAACGGGSGGVNLGTDGDKTDTTKCNPDSSDGPTTAFPATEGTALHDTICPQQDQDYWLVTGAGGTKKLLNVNLEYDKLSSIQLEADVYGPQGRCMPNALTTCTSNTQCSGETTLCDTARGACRSPTSPICFDNSNCAAGQQCYSITNVAEFPLLGQVQIPASSDLKHVLNANYPAFEQGNYVVVVYDHTEKTVDSQVQYALTVSELTDVDPNEPNDAQNQATPLTSNMGVNGTMSYVGDIDWFTISPLSGSPTVIKVTLTYPASSTIAPTWTLIQGTGTYQGPSPVTSGEGGSALVTQSAAVVNLGTGPIYVQVSNGNPNNVNITDRYTLTVELTQDPDEGNSRNDLVTNATGVTGNQTLGNRHIVASNDFDWYALTRPGGSSTNSLVQIDCTADAAAPYSLTLQYWSETAQTCDHTSASNTCAQGNPCDLNNHCLQLLIQRPDPDDAHGDPQVGGRAPNKLHTQLPILNTNNVWVRVANNPSTTLAIPGYDNESSSPYSIQFTFNNEPDAGDAANPPDNSFIGRPSEHDTNIGDFHPNYRNTNFTPSGGGTSGSATGYITYDGDQDFFSWTPSSALGPGGLTITVNYGASEVDLRATLQRDDNTVAVEAVDSDFCGTGATCEAGGTCETERATCKEVALTMTVPTGTQCSHTESTSTGLIKLWVNDIDSNDWDDSTQYSVTWSYVAGCEGPGAQCPATAGAACAGH